MKICYRCNILKEEDKFYNFKKTIKNPMSIFNSCKECYRFYQRNYYKNNREKSIEKSKIWNKKNYEKVKNRIYEYRINKREKYLQTRRLYQKNNKEKTSLWDKNKRANRRKAASDKTITADSIKNLFKLYKNKCYYCEKKTKNLTIDHYIPICKGGEHSIKNIVPACRDCNSKKTFLSPYEFSKKFGKLF